MATDPTNSNTPANTDPIGDPAIGIQVHMRDLKKYIQDFITALGQAMLAYKNISNLFTKSQSVQMKTLVISAGAVGTDAAESNMFRIAAGSSFTLSNPTNLKDGQSITWKISKSVANVTVSFGANFRYLGAGTPDQSVGANTVDVVTGFWDATDAKFYFDMRRGN